MGVRAPYRNYENNQRAILEAYQDIKAETGALPTYKELAEKTGLSINTIYAHFRKIDFDFICKRARIHTPGVIDSLAEKAQTGNSRDRKLYLQVIEGLILKTSEEKKVLGDLKVDSNVSGEVKVTVERRVITSREELEKLKNLPSAKPAPVKGDGAEGEKRGDVSVQEIPIVGTATAMLLGDEEPDVI